MLKICVIMFYTKNYKIGSHTENINREYCKKNNYTFVVYNNVPNELESRHSSWCKHYYLLENIENFDYVMWIDADAFFCNHSIKIEDWIDKSDNKDYIIARDAGYSRMKYSQNKKFNKDPLLNSGVIIMKNTENNKNLLKHILYDPIHEDNYNKTRSTNSITRMHGWDQAAVRYVYKQNVLNMKENMWISTDTNLNNNCHPKDIDEYIENGGYIIHLTTFMGTYKPRDMRTVKRFKSILGLK
ncbi:MAG: hypothetical protein Ct9H90mP28_1870 [Paracoccaceae bacterium]|nr:MAG: hypothetical protein Ct9H90mP28_1870 [Paracoccaceae bacterium]